MKSLIKIVNMNSDSFFQNTLKPKPQPRSKVLPDLPSVPPNLPDIPDEDKHDDEEIDFDDLSRRFEELKKRH